MRKTTINNKLNNRAGKTGLTLLAGALLVLIGLPLQSVAAQQTTALESAINSRVVFGSADNYGDTQQDEEDWNGTYAPNKGKAKSDLMSKRGASLEVIALNDQTKGTEKSGYGEIVLDED